MQKPNPLPPLAELQKRLSYDPETGVFRWEVKAAQRAPAGSVAGGRDSKGYLRVRHDGVLYPCHRLAWLFVYEEDPGELEVDHINGNKSDNRISNLRITTREGNRQNIGAYTSNKSGHKGVHWHKDKHCWVAQVKAYGFVRRAGGFVSAEAAHSWAVDTREALHGEFANHDAPVAGSATVAAVTTANHPQPCELLKN